MPQVGSSLIDIGMMLGYQSPSHFSQVFRQGTGLTPSNYRQRRASSPGDTR